MATRGPRAPGPRWPAPRATPTGPRLDPRARPSAPRPDPTRAPRPEPALPPAASAPTGTDRREERGAEARLLGEGSIGAPELEAERFADFGDLIATRHLFSRMAAPKSDRSAEVTHLGSLLLGLADGARARRVLEPLFSAERFFDIYPLELLFELVERAPGYVPRASVGSVIENRAFVESRIFEVEEVIPLRLALAAKVRAFALYGGASPGYCLSPGPPGRYELEMAGPGRFQLLLGARIHGEDRVEQVPLWVEDGPENGE